MKTSFRFMLLYLLLMSAIGSSAQAGNQELPPGDPPPPPPPPSNYDVGVFYMPFWAYTGSPFNGNWKHISDYKNYISLKGKPERGLSPLSIYPGPNPQWYDDSRQDVVEKQMELMNRSGIDFVIYDAFYFWNGSGVQPYYESALYNQHKPGFNNHGMKFALMWADRFMDLIPSNGTGCNEFYNAGGGLDQLVAYWSQHFANPNYKRIDGKPVVYIFYNAFDPDPNYTGPMGNPVIPNIEGMTGMCMYHPFFSSMGNDIYEPYISHKKVNFLLSQIKAKAATDIYFVAVVNPPKRKIDDPDPQTDWTLKYTWLVQHPELAGYNAVTSYGYDFWDWNDLWGGGGTTLCTGTWSPHNWSFNYNAMKATHANFYSYAVGNIPIDYQIPVTPGFNRSSLNKFEREQYLAGLGPQPGHYAEDCLDYIGWPKDQAIGTPTDFADLLQTAKSYADAYPQKTRKTIVISAWNEYGEGNVIEPTEYWNYQYVNVVRNAFKPWLPVVLRKDKPVTASTATPTPEINQLKAGTGFDFSVVPNPVKNDLFVQVRQNGLAKKNGITLFYLYNINTHSVVKTWSGMNGLAYYKFDISGLPRANMRLKWYRHGKEKRSM